MRKFILASIFIISAFALLSSCQGDQKNLPSKLIHNPKSASGKQADNLPEISFVALEHDYGRLIQGEIVSHVFKFTNTGKSDLIISKVSASCGCTASKYTKAPVKPGEEGRIEVSFDTGGQRGIQNKTITVLTNGKPLTTVLRIKAQVTTSDSY